MVDSHIVGLSCLRHINACVAVHPAGGHQAVSDGALQVPALGGEVGSHQPARRGHPGPGRGKAPRGGRSRERRR